MCIYKNPCEYCNFAQCDKMPIDGIRDLSSKLLLYIVIVSLVDNKNYTK